MAEARSEPARPEPVPGPGGLARWTLAAEAALWLTLAGLALRVLSFARIAGLAGRPPRAARAGAVDAPAAAVAVAWAVDAASRRAPWRARCFERGLAAHLMLRRRGRDSTLYYGARNDDSRGPSAHVWVRLDALPVVGCEEAAGFAVLARFPDPPPETS